jgi:hypothetical protein
MTEDDNDGVPDIDEIDSREKLETYLLDKPLDWSRQISLRIALRVFPFVLDEFSNSQVHRNLCVQSWRALFISSIADNISDISMRISARAAAKATDAARADAHVTNATTTSSFAASRAASIAATANADTPAANAATNAAKTAAKSADAAARTNPSIWINIRNDLHDLKVVGDIVHHRLFDTENLPSALATKLSDFNKHAHATHNNWIIISQWYQTLLNSNMSKTPWGVLGSKTDIEIALKKDVFWDRDPDVVIAEIAEIVGWNEVASEVGNQNHELASLIAEQKYLSASLKQESERFGPSRSVFALEEYYFCLSKPRSSVVSGALDASMSAILHDDWSAEQFKNGIDAFSANHRKILDHFLFSTDVIDEMDETNILLQSILETEDNELGVSYAHDSDQFMVVNKVDKSDIESINDPNLQKLFPEIKRLADQFRDVGTSLDNQYGWSGIAHHATR